MSIKYGNMGLNTVGSLYWAAVAFAGVGVLTVSNVQLSGPVPLAVTGCIWVIGVFVVTVRVLRRLSKLEEEHREPDDAMHLAFYCAAILPILGSVGRPLCHAVHTLTRARFVDCGHPLIAGETDSHDSRIGH